MGTPRGCAADLEGARALSVGIGEAAHGAEKGGGARATMPRRAARMASWRCLQLPSRSKSPPTGLRK
eukprot:7847618-Alexandrium_andersonii.AAC.1